MSWFALGVLASFSFHALTGQENNFTLASSEEISLDTPSEIAQTAPSAPIELEVAQAPLPAQTPAGEEKPDLAIVVSEASETPAAKPAMQLPAELTLTVEKGDTLSTVLDNLGVPSAETHEVVEAVRKYYNPKKLAVGQDINVHLGQNPDDATQPIVKSMMIPLSVISSLEVIRKPDEQFLVKRHDAKLYRKPTHISGEITSSLYETAVQTGIPIPMISNIINAYSYDVDFQREIKSGDHISVLFERLETNDGKSAGYGDILYAKLLTGNHTYMIYRYVDANGDSDFYNEKGESVRKGLLRTPINGARITSSFGMRRHPILGYSKMHRGVDFGASTGTPIYAAGDGIVEKAGRFSSYGNYLRIKHNDTYATAYGHIHRFASGIAPGKKVKQGQIVAYVGSTGRSTGPHLHYEILANGKQVNPSGVKFKTGTVLRGKELAQFKKQVTQMNSTIAAKEAETKVAMLGKPQTAQ